jgi:hypothetical protein
VKRPPYELLACLVLGAMANASAAAERPRVEAVRTHATIRVDGLLDEPAWNQAAVIRGFQLILQREGEVPSESTEVRVLVDDDRIHFGIVCDNRNPGAVRASLTPRDRITDGDHIAVHLDTYRDHRRAYIFGINPYGVELDGILDGEDPDFSWDAVWEGGARRNEAGWTAEISIPLHAMRFPRQGDGVWGIWIRREITKNDEVCSWPLWKRSVQGDIMLQAGDLAGMIGLSGGGGLDAEPYVSSEAQQSYSYSSLTDPVSLTRSGQSTTSNHAGLDLRYPVTSTLIANATVNPDYSQVEADAIQIDVNQRFPLFFEEKRPFFLEGAEIFSTPLDLVYTRRIADPSFGGKITGKQGRTSIGLISVRDDGGGSMAGIGAGSRDQSPRGEFHIGRLAYDLGESSRLGLLVAGHRRENFGDDVPQEVVLEGPVAQGGHNLVFAGDARLRLARTWFFTGQLAWSDSRVDSSYDTRGEHVVRHGMLSDVGYDARVRFADGIRSAELFQSYLGPEFRDESGFLSRVDVRTTGINTHFFSRPENHVLRSMQPILDGYAVHDHTGGLQEWWVSPMVDWLFQKQSHMHTMYVREMQRWLGRDYELNTYILNLDNSLWRPLALSFQMEVGEGIFYAGSSDASYRGWRESYVYEATARPDPRLTSELVAQNSRFSRSRGGAEVYDVWALGAKTTFQFTRRLYARVYPQYDTGEHHLDADALVGYVLHPGSVLYLGVSSDYERLEGRHRPMRRTLFFKASHRFGI